VSSFGISGTNAHVVLEQPPVVQEQSPVVLEQPLDTGRVPRPGEVVVGGGVVPWVLSARSPQALREAAARLGEYAVAHPGVGVGLVGSALVRRRAVMEHRAVVLARSVEAAVAGLSAVAADEAAAGVVTGEAIRKVDPVLVFPGQGSQWVGMGRELLVTSPVFAEWIARCQTAFAPYVEWSLEPVLRGEDAAALERVDVVQPALFAVLTGVAQLWQHHGVTASAVLGHSQGEIAAACVAGALSLDDAARVVTLRSKALVELAGTGAMASVMLGRQATEELLQPWQQRLSVAAANGPSTTIVSGEIAAMEEMLRQLEGAGTWARRIPVDYSSHSAQIEAIRDTILSALHGITPRPARIPFYSAYTGGQIDTTELTAGYWYANLRHTVQFQTATERLLAQGHRLFIESSPHPVLTTALQQTIEESGHHAAVLPTLHRDQATLDDFTTSLARAYTHGAAINWDTLLPTDTTLATDLPTYPFQHQRYWPDTTPTTTTPTNPHAHPFLDTSIEHADTGNLLLSGHLCLTTHPWLADHTIAGTTIFPGTGFLELALHAAHEAGCHHLEELTLETPLLLPEHETTDIQVTVGPEDHTRTRPITIHTRTHTALPGTPWTRHARGELAVGVASPTPAMPTAWPPAGAEEEDLTGLYPALTELGLHYGPNFRGLRAVWRRGEELFAEVSLPESIRREADRFVLHPALLDAALHPLGLDTKQMRLPFSWNRVFCRRSGVTALRVRIAPAGPEQVSISVTDDEGAPVVSVEALVLRPVDPGQLAAVRRAPQDVLLRVGWEQASTSQTQAWARIGRSLAILGGELPTIAVERYQDLTELRQFLDSGGAVPDAVVAPFLPRADADPAGEVVRLLTLLQGWLADQRLTDSRLVIVTRGAVATGTGEDVPDLIHSPLWGLVRSAQVEEPDRFMLVDVDGQELPGRTLSAVLRAGHPQSAVRNGAVVVPRLARVAVTSRSRLQPLDPEGTVLITGGLGALGGLVAVHLTREHGARHLHLAGRRGLDTPGAGQLVADLTNLGARVTVAACDVANREALGKLMRSVPVDHPLTAVVHAAGGLEDGVIESLGPDAVERVFAPKAEAAWHLHELTKDLPLARFVMFSSASGVLGSAGQANYAAANTLLDALAHHRRAHGLPATSIAWGYWEQVSGMTRQMDRADLARLSRAGIAPLPTKAALTLLDAAEACAEPLLVAARLNPTAEIPSAPLLLRNILQSPGRTTSVAGDPAALRVRLTAMRDSERRGELLELVRAQIAAVLAHASPSAIPADRRLRELGFDSLGAVQLRNNLSLAAGLKLPATVAFDHPTAGGLAGYLLEMMFGGDDVSIQDGECAPDAGAGPERLKGSEQVDVAEDAVRSATDRELFAMIDQELGLGEGVRDDR
jgi:acyl transferase domain-containing protein/acyl carrier protein